MSNWWYDNGDLVLYIVAVVFILAAMFCGYAVFDKAQCAAKTERIGFDSTWSVLGGCQIEVQPGQWIPLDSYYFKQE